MSLWQDGLLDEQIFAAAHTGDHICMLAGPGTGKTLTLTRRVMHLIQDRDVSPDKILVITFTRAATQELRNRISDVLPSTEAKPHVSTLHAFALRQLLRNSGIVDALPKPIRIADDWEEDEIVRDDLRRRLSYTLKKVRDLFNNLSADWDRLDADSDDWAFIDPRFLGAWEEHRKVYGYTMRSELVYQVKKSLEQSGDFQLESDFEHFLVDEYQDLNKCDLAVVKSVTENGAFLFAAGDDDQSIYGFRYAHPDGIRNFDTYYPTSHTLTLNTCMRCDKQIIAVSEFVANLDPDRIPKNLKPREDAGPGHVSLIHFNDESDEADGIASLCDYLIRNENIEPNDIIILLRNDRNRSYSKTIRTALQAKGLPSTTDAERADLTSSDPWRKIRAVLQLVDNPEDSLAIRSWLQVNTNYIGSTAFDTIFEQAKDGSLTFAQAIRVIQSDPDKLPKFGQRVKNQMDDLDQMISGIRNQLNVNTDDIDHETFISVLRDSLVVILADEQDQERCFEHLQRLASQAYVVDISQLNGLLQTFDASREPLDQPSEIAIMTMHKAKGLTSEIVIIAACEDQVIPGEYSNDNELGDERRLLYVSLTRAKSALFATYCDRRTGASSYTRAGQIINRQLTGFLRNVHIAPQQLNQVLADLAQRDQN